MKKRYFYEFQGRIFIKADDQDHAEKLVTNISLDDYLIDENLYQVDGDYIPIDIQQRQEQLGTHFHPMDDYEEYEKFRKRVRQYGKIFNKFLNGEIDRDDLVERMDQAEGKEIDDGDLIYQVQMVDLETKEPKTAKLVSVD